MSRRLIIRLCLVAGALTAAFALVVGGCARDPAVAPFLGSGEAEVALRLLDGTLAELPADSPATDSPREQPADSPAAAPAKLAVAPCAPPQSGFPDDVSVQVTVNPPTGGLITRSFDIPARTGHQGLVVDGLPPGNGYVVEVEVQMRGLMVFEGASPEFMILPGGRTPVGVELSPPFGRRAVLAAGAAQIADPVVLVPVLLSHSLPLRGLEFELCFDPEVLEPVGARAVGSRVGAFRGAGGQPGTEGIYHVILWSPDPEARLAPGRDQVLELEFRFRSVNPLASSNLVFVSALATDDADSLGFTTYFFDRQVQR